MTQPILTRDVYLNLCTRSKFQPGDCSWVVLNFWANLSLGVLFKFVLIKKKCVYHYLHSVAFKFDLMRIGRQPKQVGIFKHLGTNHKKSEGGKGRSFFSCTLFFWNYSGCVRIFFFCFA